LLKYRHIYNNNLNLYNLTMYKIINKLIKLLTKIQKLNKLLNVLALILDHNYVVVVRQ